MTDAELVLLVYCIGWTIWGHWRVLRDRELRRKKKRRSVGARKAAATRRRNQALKPETPRGDRIVEAPSAWFRPEEDGEVEYNEVDLSTWAPIVRRFDGSERDYAERDRSGDSVP